MRKVFLFICIAWSTMTLAQGVPSFPAPQLRTDLIPPSPNAASFARYESVPVNLYNGQMGLSVPLMEIKQGVLSLPITLTYNYNGSQIGVPSWVGNGWNLNAGGMITRVIKDKPDGSWTTGKNYDQYAIYDSAVQVNNQLFLKDVSENGYDTQPDEYIYNFAGHSGRFIVYKGRVYLSSSEKIKVIGPGSFDNNGPITIIDESGTTYEFAATEQTYIKPQPDAGFTIEPYTSTWFLTTIMAPNKIDAIYLNYTNSFIYRGLTGNYSQVYTQDMASPATFNIRSTFNPSPQITALCLQSVSTAKGNIIYFDTTARSDVHAYPSLGSMRMYDYDGTLVSKWQFNYSMPGKLNLTSLERVPVDTATKDTSRYLFDYIPGGAIAFLTRAVDFWGYSNGVNNASLFDSQIFPQLASGYPTDRTPHFEYTRAGALTKVTYPTGGTSSFEYEPNYYQDASGNEKLGPGIRIKTIISLDSASMQPVIKTYEYKGTDGKTSGVLFSQPDYSGTATEVLSKEEHMDVEGQVSIEYPHNYYQTYQGSYSNIGGDALMFYYSRVKEKDSAAGKTLETVYNYSSSVNDWKLGVSLLSKKTYLRDPVGTQILKREENYTYYVNEDTTFVGISAWKNFDTWVEPGDTWNYTTNVTTCAWKYLLQTQTTDYDDAGTSGTVSTVNTYDAYRNLQSVTTHRSNGNELIHKFKYPENYTSAITGTLVTEHLLSVPLEHQVWVKSSPTNIKLLSGEITQFDNTLLQPVSKYYLESNPLTALNSEGTTDGLYNTLLSDSRYVKRVNFTYNNTDGLLAEQYMDNNIKQAYVWTKDKTGVIAQAINTSADQIAYTSFENEGSGWSGISNTDIANIHGSVMGNSYYNLANTTLSKAGLNVAITYIVSYWSEGSASIVSGTQSGWPKTGKTVSFNGHTWTLYIHEVTGVSMVTVSGNVHIDELRLYPKDAQMTSLAYAPLVGPTAKNDERNMIAYFEYDGLNRASVIRDADKQILKQFRYAYKQAIQNPNAPQWQPTGTNRCEVCPANNSYITGNREQQERDINPGSSSYNQTRWVNIGPDPSSPCSVTAGWQNTTTSVRCKLNSVGNNTGETEQEQMDRNPCSPTYTQTQWVVSGTNTTACPLATTCNNCTGTDKKCINGNCETGVKVYYASVFVPGSEQWKCFFNYEFSDGSSVYGGVEFLNDPCTEE